MIFKPNWKKKRILFLLILILTVSLTMLTGCMEKQKEDKFVVVTSFYPMYVFTENIMDGANNVELRNLTEPQTGCLHDYQMKPSDMAALEKADLFIVNGAGMENFLDNVKKVYPKLKIVEASDNIPLLKDENGEENPHVWVSVSNAILQVRNIGTALKAQNAENAALYQKNETAYLDSLESLRKEMHQALTPYKGKKIITFHEAFPYFAEEFGLSIASVIEREPGSEPSAKELADTIKIVKASKVKCLFSEPQYSNRSAEVISRETGAKVYTLDPFVTGVAGDRKDGYQKTMKKNLEVLKEALK